jgi:glutamine amidotransferase
MCRLLGCVAQEPTSLRHELIEAPRPLIRPSEENASGWGMAVYERADAEQPHCIRFPNAASMGSDFSDVAATRGRILMAHVRRATFGGLSEANTHPFCLAEYSFCHNGTIGESERLLGLPDGTGPLGETDSERFFHRLLREVDPDPDRVCDGLRRAVTAAIESGPISGASFLFSDGERLYAYRLGAYELHWLSRPGQLLVASDRITKEPWHDVRQDVLLVLDPREDEPHAERLVGDDVLARMQVGEFRDVWAHDPPHSRPAATA